MDRPSSGSRGIMLRNLRARSMSKLDKPVFDVLPDELAEQHSADGTSSTASFDRLCSDILGDGSLVGSPRETFWDGDESTTTSNSVDSSPLAWPLVSRDRSRLGKLYSLPRIINSRDTFGWEETKETKVEDPQPSEVEMMKERFAKLLLGEDLSGGGKGVSSALAISNAITNLSASVFGELWRLEPLAQERKARWRREMGWLLSVSDYIVEFVPSSQVLPNGSIMEVMVTKPRSDLHINLPAMRKLDTMLLDALDSFSHTEFWYVDRAMGMAEKDGNLLHRQEEKWWLPTPRVPSNGLCMEARKHLQHQKECISQILKAALAINAQVLSEMEVPAVYWDALPKNGRSSLGEALYRTITSEHFSPDVLIASIDHTHEHNILELVNRVEAAIHIWRRKLQNRQTQMLAKEARASSKPSWGLPKEGAVDPEKREVLSERAESLLLLLRQKFPGLPQTILDMNKIQYNKDIGQSILESYSRVLESLAFNIMSRIDDVLHVDDVTKSNQHSASPRNPSTNRGVPPLFVQMPMSSPYGTPAHPSQFSSLSRSASINADASPRQALQNKTLSEFIGWSIKAAAAETRLEPQYPAKFPPWKVGPLPNKQWSYSGNINTMRSPPSRD